jgi:hypothetical protein
MGSMSQQGGQALSILLRVTSLVAHTTQDGLIKT